MSSKTGIQFVCILAMLCAGPDLERAAQGQASTASGTGKTASDPFVGKWKLDPSRSRMSDEMKVAGAGGNKYVFDFGAGNPETIVADGTDQTGGFGTMLAVSVEAPNMWRVVRKQNGHTIISARWELSEDGNALTDHFTSFKSDGSSNTTDYHYKRTAGTAGFVGTWESTLPQEAFELQIQPFEDDGLALSLPDLTRKIKLDGKDYPVTGGNLPAGFTTSGRRVNERTLELTDKVEGKPVDTQHTEISADLKTLTLTLQNQSQSKPKVMVFTRE